MAEKRTALSTLRTGIAVFALPLSVLSILIATSRYYDFVQVKYWLVPLLGLSLALVILGSYLVIQAMYQIHHYDRLIAELKRKHGVIAKVVD